MTDLGFRPITPVAFNRVHWTRLADGLAVALAVSLPWSTSATEILAWLWLFAVIPTIDRTALWRVLRTPAGGIPVLLFVLAALGMLWAFGLPFGERLNGLKSVYKFLFIPILLVHFQRSEHGTWVVKGFLASCIVLLALSWFLFFAPPQPWWVWRGHGGTAGVPVKDYIIQAEEFCVCAFLVAPLAVHAWCERRRGAALALTALILAFLVNAVTVATSRTALVVLPVLLLLFVWKKLDWRAACALLFAALLGAAVVWSVAPTLRHNVNSLWAEVTQFQPEGKSTRAGERLEFWKKSVGFIAAAPVIGHGTGSIHDQFRRSVAGQTGMAALASENPHNQTLAVAIQLGIVGTLLLFAMWLAHLLAFRGEGFAAWAGLIIVTQNIVGSLFNSHLFDFTQGWAYVIGVGVAAGVLFKQRDAPQPAAADRVS
jgi:hypothetical protein